MRGVAAATVWLVLRGQGAQRTVGWMMLVGQSVKLLVEEPWGAAIHPPSELDVAVAPLAHASGSIAGALFTLLALRLTRPARDRLCRSTPTGDPVITLCGFSVSNYYNKVKLALLEKGIPFAEERVVTKSSRRGRAGLLAAGQDPVHPHRRRARCARAR